MLSLRRLIQRIKYRQYRYQKNLSVIPVTSNKVVGRFDVRIMGPFPRVGDKLIGTDYYFGNRVAFTLEYIDSPIPDIKNGYHFEGRIDGILS